MKTERASHLAGTRTEVLSTIRGAAISILERFGRDQSDDRSHVKAAFVGGFMIAYFRAEPDEVARRRKGNWNTQEGRRPDPFQHLIDIRVGEQVVGLGWRGDGPIRTDCFIRGPWEFELLKAAGIGISLPPGTLRPLAAVPESKSRWQTAEAFDPAALAMLSSRPLTFTVVGYHSCQSCVVEPGTDFAELRQLLADCYLVSRNADGDRYENGDPTSCFALEGRIGRRIRGGAPPKGRPGFSYFIGSDDGLSVAASILLQFANAPIGGGSNDPSRLAA